MHQSEPIVTITILNIYPSTRFFIDFKRLVRNLRYYHLRLETAWGETKKTIFIKPSLFLE